MKNHFPFPSLILILVALGICPGSIGGEALADPAFGARHPALSPDGSQLAFSWRGDIWVVAGEGGQARRLTVNLAYESFPSWSPDGREIAFSSGRNGNNDIYVIDVAGGTPERLTWHSDDDDLLCWGSDGKLYFSASRESRMNLVFAVAREGGRPQRVLGDLGFNASLSPDGKWLAYVRGYTNWWRKNYRGPASRDIWLRPIEGGESRHVLSWRGKDDRPFWSADGRSLFFESERDDGVSNLWRQDLRFSAGGVEPEGLARQLTHLDGDGMQFLNVSRDGRLAVFESEGRLWTVPTAGGEPRRLEIDCAGDFKNNEYTRRVLSSGATEYAFAPGEKQLAFVVQGEIYASVVKDGELQDAIRLTETDAREKDLVWLDEDRLLFVSDRHGQDDIFLISSSDDSEARLGKSRYRETTRLTDAPETEYSPQVSPDGETILYRKDTGFIWTMEPDGDDQEQLIDSPAVLHVDWSPDSRYIAYSLSNNGSFEDIFVYDTHNNEGESINVSNHPNDDWHPLWSGDGLRLAWASRTADERYMIRYLWLTHEEADKSESEREREEEAEDEDDEDKDDEDNGEEEEEEDDKDAEDVVVKIDWNDIPDRIRTVVRTQGGYWDYDQSPDGKHYALRTNMLEGMDLWTVDWDGDKFRKLTSGANPDRMLWSEDSEKLRYISHGQIMEIANDGDGSPNSYGFSVELTVDGEARRLQKLGEAWRLLNDGFYDENFHGADWPAMREKYEPLARTAVMPEDLKDVIREMIGELNASHLGCYGGPRSTSGNDRTGLLGFRPDDDYDGKGVKVAWVLPRGPLDREGKRVEAGEIILAINGEPIEPGANYYEMLKHKAGEEVDLDLRGRKGKERRITIEPAFSVWWLAYRNWMDENRSMVDELSGDRIGYLHMSAMGNWNLDAFVADIFSRARNKDALILDVRFNDGGNIHDQMLTFLSRKVYGYTTNRGREGGTFDAQERWNKPIVLLINERSYSDGEIFPWGFKALGLGRIVGMPTFGAVIGTSDTQLIDGTGFRVPGSGWYRINEDGSVGRNMENDPITPDIFVPDVPEENLRGRDAQIERAVAECLEMLN